MTLKYLKQNNQGLASIFLVVVLVVGIGAIALWAASSQNSTYDPNSIKPASSPLESDNLSPQTLSALEGIFGEEPNKNIYSLLEDTSLTPDGSITNDTLEITKTFGTSFTLGPEDTQAFEGMTGFKLDEGTYSFFIIETSSPPTNPDILYQAGFGFTPSGHPTSAADQNSLEPLAKNPQAYTFFSTPDNSWQEIPALDAANNYQPLDSMAYIYLHPEHNLSAFLVPQDIVGTPGEPSSISIQLFGRQFQEVPEDLPSVSVSGGTCDLDSLSTPLGETIFADGFESGDITAWTPSISGSCFE